MWESGHIPYALELVLNAKEIWMLKLFKRKVWNFISCNFVKKIIVSYFPYSSMETIIINQDQLLSNNTSLELAKTNLFPVEFRTEYYHME